MNNDNPFKLDFDSYILQSEPEKQENGKLWQTAIGLQQVDGLTPSKYLYETAKRNIDGEITIEEAKELIDSYYETRQGRTEDENCTEEADKVSVRIREILAEKTFTFTPDLLLGEHNELKNRYCHIKYNEKVAVNSQKGSDKVAVKEKSSDIILNYLKENSSINNSKAREITGLTSAAVRKIFKKLEAEGLIIGSGENKNRTYSLKR